MGDVADKSVMVDPARDLLGRALEDLRRCQTWSLRGVEGFYLEGSRTPDGDYHRFDAGAGMSGAVYITGEDAYLAGVSRVAAFGPAFSAQDLATWGDQWVRMPARRLVRENHDAGLAPQLAKLCDPYAEVRLLDSRTETENTRHLIRVDAFGEPITWEVLTSGSSVELAGALARDGTTPLARVHRGIADLWPPEDPATQSLTADEILREHHVRRAAPGRARTDRAPASFDVVHDADAGTWWVLSSDAATCWAVGNALNAELIAREHLASTDHDLAQRVSYDSEASLPCVICDSRTDALLIVRLLRSCPSAS